MGWTGCFPCGFNRLCAKSRAVKAALRIRLDRASFPLTKGKDNGTSLNRRPASRISIADCTDDPRRAPDPARRRASWLGVGVAVAGALVEFPNVSEQAPKLTGYLARPDAGLSALAGHQFDRVGPYPAVVVLRGCAGISSHSTGIADWFGSWGYVTLAVDSLSPRGISSACGSGSLGQAFDAYGRCTT